jgi:iron complex transport system substrate-binding protein
VRIISLTSSNTEIVTSLGCGHDLVGVDSNSDWPAHLLAGLPRLGPDLRIDLVALERLEPDLVISSLSVPGMERVVDGVSARGLRQLVLDPISWTDVLRDIQTVADALGVPERGQALVCEMETRVLELRGTLPAVSRPSRVMIEWWPKPVIVATRDSWVTDMLAVLGAVNAFAGIPKRSSPITTAQGLEAAPELIVCSWCGVKKLRPELIQRRAGWEQVPAIQNARVVCVPESGLGRPGPRLLEGLEGLANALRTLDSLPVGNHGVHGQGV